MSGRYPGGPGEGAADDPRAPRHPGGYGRRAYGARERGEQWPAEQEYGYPEQGYQQDFGQAGDPRPGSPRDGRGERGPAARGGGRRDGGVWGADAPLPTPAPQDTGREERSLPPRGSAPRGSAPPGSGPQRAQPGRDAFPSGPQRAQPADNAFQSGPWRARGDGRDQRDREPFSSGAYRAQPGREPRLSGPQQAEPDAAPRRGAGQRGSPQYGLPEYGSSRDGSAQHGSPRQGSSRQSGPHPQPDGRRTTHRETGGFQMANDYTDGDLVPGFGAPSGDRDYGRDYDRDDWRGDRRADPRRRPGRDQYDDDRYPDGRRGREDRSAGDRYRDDEYEDDGYGDGQRGARPGDGRRGGDRYPRDWHDTGRGAGGNERSRYDDDEEDRQPRRERRRIRRLAPWIALAVVLVFLGVVGGGGLYAYRYLQAKDHPPDYTGAGAGPQVLVQVMSGDTPTSLAPRLVQDGVVKSTAAFIKAAEASTSSADIEAGFYQMNRQMQASLAYAYLINPKNVVTKGVTLPEGLRVSDTLIRLSKGTGIPVADFQAVLKKQASQLGLPAYAKDNPEGYLFPATYPIQPHETPLAILQGMVGRFDQEAQAVNLPASLNVPASGGTVRMSTAQLVIVASLVQAEAGRDQDMSKIAEVIYNRLEIGMPLKFDSTVFYGLGKYGTSATDAEINTPGPYNTYQNKGLTPTPIDSPGDAAIQAALHPATGNLLYFFGCSSGATVFSATQPPTSASC